MKRIYTFQTILSFLFFLGTNTQLQGATITWLGNYSSAWDNASNWNSGVPDSTDNIIINSNAPYNLTLTQNRKITNFTINGDTIDLGGYEFTITGTATFNGGKLTGGTLLPTGTLCHFGGGAFDVTIAANCGYFHMNGGVFKRPTSLISSGTASTTGSGNCVFEDSLTITNSGVYYFTMGSSGKDYFHGPLTINNTSTHEVYLSTGDSAFFSHNVILNSTNGGGVTFGNTGGVSTLAAGKTITIGTTGFTNDYLTLKNFKQLGTTSQTLTLSGTAIVNMVNCTFNGSLTVSSPGFLIKDNVFNGATSLTRTASSGNHQSDGGNVFNSSLNCDNQGVSGRIRWASTTADVFFGNATFNSTGGSDVQLCYTGNSYFYGDITINSNKVVFNTSNGKVTFAGGNSQTLNGSYNFPFKKLAINKTGGYVTSNATFSVDDTLFFIKGSFITKSTNELTLKLNSKVVGASDSSYVQGPVKKIGNTAFVFPTGANNSYRPIEISAPSTTTSEFVGEFVEDSVPIHTVQRDSTLGFLIRNKYWKLNRTSGSSQVYVTLSWDSLNALVDTFVNVASWNGSQWNNLGKGTVYGSKVSGSIKSTSVATSYNEFILGYYSNESLPSPLDCDNVQDWLTLKICLANIPTTGFVEITDDIFIDNSGPIFINAFPFEVQSGVTLQSQGSSTKWWEPNCHLISTNHEGTYTNSTDINRRSLYLFVLQGGGTIQNLRIRGADCNFKDDNEDTQLSGGIHVENGSGIAVIRNCEISCFSHSGVWKDDLTEQLDIENCYIHKVKGTQDLYGIGYGVWTQSIYEPVSPLDDPQKVNFINNIFDDCKAAIDGQAKFISWDINKCSLTQFFSSEDINMHNDNRFEASCPCSNSTQASTYYLNHWAFTNSNNAKFYGNYWKNNIQCSTQCGGTTFVSTPGIIFGELSGAVLSYYYTLLSNEIPIHDIGGAKTSITNSIFHKKWTLGVNGNINCNFPNLDALRAGNSSNFVDISDNTFATEEFDKDEVLTTQDNNSGYAKIADNYIEADIRSNVPLNIINDGNSFNYKPGSVVASTAPQPHELSLNLTDGTNSLSTTYTLSPLQGHKYIQFVNVNTSFDLEATITNAGGSAESHYLIRPNSNNNSVTTTSESHVISNENYFYDGEVIESGNAISRPITYNKPGLYGIDVIGFDAHDYGAPDHYNFKASSWQHIPVIVKGTQEQVLYFNIKDSYEQDGATTGVKKQAYLNQLLIWEEDISEGGTGWEFVVIDLAALAVNGTTAIMDSIHTDGTDNVISFSIFMDDNISSKLVAGVSVWVDDVYIPKTGSATGDNLVRDGSMELSTEGLGTDYYWFSNATSIATGCGNTTANINARDKKSGSLAIVMVVPYDEDCTPYSGPDPAGQVMASVGTLIDFTDLLSCDDYWNGTSSNVGFEEMDKYSFDGGVTYPYTNRKLVVDGDIEIKDNNTTLVFTGCQIVFKPHNPPYTIKVKNDATLKLEYLIDSTDPFNVVKLATHLFACDDMWGGIINEAGGVIDIISESNAQLPTKIEDADKAIQSDDGDVNIRFAHFNNNYIGIELINYDKSPSISANDEGFLGITFSCSDSILTKPLHAGEQPLANFNLIDVVNVNIGGVGSPTGYKNKLNDAIYGIRSHSSTALILNTEFHNIGVKDRICRLCEGAIFATGGSNLTIGGLLTGTTGNPLYRNYFKNSTVGIMTKGVNYIDVKGNHFDKIGKGFIAHNASSSNITIDENNEFYNVDNGIIAREILGNVTIVGNVFNPPPSLSTMDESHYSSTAITLQNYNDYANTSNNVIVSDNTILDCRIGIHALNILNLSIGADVNGGTGNSITFNKEKGFYHCGIWIENCTSANIQSNEITKISGEFWLEGINITESADALVNMNTITSADAPINVRGSCNDTEFHCNVFDNDAEPGLGVQLVAADLPPQGGISDPWNNEWYGYDNNTLFGVTGGANTGFDWFYDDSDVKYNPYPEPGTALAQPTSFTGSACAVQAATNDPDRDVRYAAIAEDSLAFIEYENEFIYKAKKYLFEQIYADTSLLTKNTNKDTTFNRFYSDLYVTNIGLFRRVDSLIMADNLAAALTLNDTIPAANEMEWNLKTVNSLLISKVLVDSALSSTDSSTLESIAIQDPIIAGKAVFIARSILFREVHNELPGLRTMSQLPEPLVTEIKTASFQIIPNPAFDQCEILFEAMEQDFILELRNGVGQVLYHKKLPSHTTKLDLPLISYKPGFYLVTTISEANGFQYKKLIIAR